jgi:hypothetical protein
VCVCVVGGALRDAAARCLLTARARAWRALRREGELCTAGVLCARRRLLLQLFLLLKQKLSSSRRRAHTPTHTPACLFYYAPGKLNLLHVCVRLRGGVWSGARASDYSESAAAPGLAALRGACARDLRERSAVIHSQKTGANAAALLSLFFLRARPRMSCFGLSLLLLLQCAPAAHTHTHAHTQTHPPLCAGSHSPSGRPPHLNDDVWTLGARCALWRRRFFYIAPQGTLLDRQKQNKHVTHTHTQMTGRNDGYGLGGQ